MGLDAPQSAVGRILVAFVLLRAPASFATAAAGLCDFDRLDGKTVDASFLKAQRRPLVLIHLTEGWKANKKWSDLERFSAEHGSIGGYVRDHDQLELRDVDTTIAEYLAGEVGQAKHVNLSASAAFFVNDYEDSRLLDRIRQDYKPPEALRHLEMLRVFSLERQHAGVALHRHQASWQALVVGQKIWYLVDPSVESVPLQAPCGFEEQDGPPPFAERCTLNAGETMYVPDNWWHATCSVSAEPSLAIGGVGSMDQWPQELIDVRYGKKKALATIQATQKTVDSIEVPAGQGVFIGGERPLYLAAAMGHTELLEKLIELGASAALSRRDGRTPLHEAARRGSLHAAAELIKKAGADISAADNTGSTSLHHACAERAHKPLVEYLLRTGAPANARRNDGRTALHVACRAHQNPVPVLRVLFQTGQVATGGKDNNGLTPLMHCAAAGHAQGVGLLLRLGGADAVSVVDNAGHDALAHALMGRGDAGVVQRLLDAGAKADEGSVAIASKMGAYMPLRHLVSAGAPTAGAVLQAAQAGHARTIEVLVRELGADPDEAEEVGRVNGSTKPLHLAALAGHFGAASTLIAARADASGRDEDGLTPLHYAATSSAAGAGAGGDASASALLSPSPKRRRAIVEALLASAGPESAVAAAAGGTTPLHLAASSGDAELARLLVVETKLADPSTKDARGASAADVAEQANHTGLAKLLRSWSGGAADEL